ncbi:MAG TPA: hypothetical protein VLI65_05175, partial [Pyrinomonadaceae bacterium]|nr:hypothetical protein [Pyrinomonadaceae bacterium]
MRRANILAVVLIMSAASMAVSAAVSVDRLLVSQVNAAPLALTPVIITFNHKPASADFAMLQSLGIVGGRYLSQLPMVLTRVNLTQFNALKTKPGVVSLYANHTMRLFDLEGRTITGIESLVRDSQVTTVNGGLPVSGKNVGIAYVDTGLDATHPDLQLGQNV